MDTKSCKYPSTPAQRAPAVLQGQRQRDQDPSQAEHQRSGETEQDKRQRWAGQASPPPPVYPPGTHVSEPGPSSAHSVLKFNFCFSAGPPACLSPSISLPLSLSPLVPSVSFFLPFRVRISAFLQLSSSQFVHLLPPFPSTSLLSACPTGSHFVLFAPPARLECSVFHGSFLPPPLCMGPVSCSLSPPWVSLFHLFPSSCPDPHSLLLSAPLLSPCGQISSFLPCLSQILNAGPFAFGPLLLEQNVPRRYSNW